MPQPTAFPAVCQFQAMIRSEPQNGQGRKAVIPKTSTTSAEVLGTGWAAR